MRLFPAPAHFLLAALAVAGCTEAPAPAPPYPQISPGCKAWQDGSSFDMSNEIRVSANTPHPIEGGGLEIGVVYSMPAGTRAEFTLATFTLSAPHGPVIARGSIGTVEREIPPIGKKSPFLLPRLPQTMFGEAFGGNVIYRIAVRFKGPLPERFDLTPPPLTIDGKTYPVRVFTYRRNEERKAYGLCGWNAQRLAAVIDVPPSQICDIVNANRPIIADTALRLGLVFSMEARYWLNLQSENDTRMALRSSKDKVAPRIRVFRSKTA